jgi:hypothetical protein
VVQGVSAISDTEHRLRDLNGVLELALLEAIDLLRERGDGRSVEEIQEATIREATTRLASLGRFPGRWSLFGGDEIDLIDDALAERDDAIPLRHELEFEQARRPNIRATA